MSRVKTFSFKLILLAAATLVSAPITLADTISLDTTDRGSYTDAGLGIADGYFAGTDTYQIYHAYFVFDLGGVVETVTAATLSLSNPPGGFFGTPDVFDVYDFAGDIADLNALNGGVAAYNDLAGGTNVASKPVSVLDGGTNVELALNSSGIALINSALGGNIAFGGVLAGALDATVYQYIFGATGNFTIPSDGRTKLILTTAAADVPEPATLLLLGGGLLGMSVRKRRSRS